MNKKEYTTKKDLEGIKKQIKEWEIELDKIVSTLYNEGSFELACKVDELSHEMMAINI